VAGEDARCNGNPAQAGLTVKVLSPDKTVMGEADGVYGPAGNSPLYVRGECEGLPRGLRPCRASHRDYVVTREMHHVRFCEEPGVTVGWLLNFRDVHKDIN